MKTYATPLQQAIDEYGASKLARVLGLPVSTVASWKDRGVPEQWETIVENALRAAIHADLDRIEQYLNRAIGQKDTPEVEH